MATGADGTRELPSGTLTFAFTDIQGSTRLVQELGAARFQDVLEDHGRIVRGAFDGHGGRNVRMEGDSFFYVFARPTEAVTAAAAAQRALHGHTFPHGAAVRVRMGLHTGEASAASADTGADYVGYDVHRAARIAAAGHGGQVLVSETTEALVRDALPTGVALRSLGDHRFKDLARAERLYQLVVPGVPSDFPRPRTLDAVRNNLPTQVTSFIGRQREIAEGGRLLADARLLTLTGPGGTGKTRLSLHIAAQAAAAFPDGVTFVALASITDPDHVAPAIVNALGLELGGTRPHRERLIEHLRDRTVLLVLDNFEQILPAATLVADLLRECPKIKIVTSSRAALRVSGEQEFPVPPMALPDARAATAEQVSQFEAVRLFIERAVAVKPDFRVTNESAPAVAEICARLDGLPLAIELAAARVKLLPPAGIMARLASRLGLLASGARDLPSRQRTLRGAIEWSHDLLDDVGRRAFARFSVFTGGAAIEDAEAVCGGDDLGGDVFEALAALVDHSLLRRDDAVGEARFLMLETIREFATERLAAAPDRDAVSHRHGDRFLALAEAAAPHLMRAERKQWLARLEREHDNLRAALDHATGHGDAERAMRLGGALWRFWQIRGHLKEGSERVGRALALGGAGDHPQARERALEAAGGLAYWQGDMATMERYYADALALARRNGDRARLANALYNASFTGWISGAIGADDLARGRATLVEAIAIARDIGDRACVARCLWGLSGLEHTSGNHDAALASLAESIPIFREVGDLFGLAWALHSLGLAYVHKGRLADARAALDEQIALLAEARDVSGVALALGDHAQLAMAAGDRPRGVRLFGASAALQKLCGAGLVTLSNVMENRTLEPAPDDEAPFGEGLALNFDEAVALALQKSAPAAPSPAA